jgi:asparagine synthase (glutamine-hydrolysing)
MCGIVGYLNKNGSPGESFIIDRMTSWLTHRGPHGNGIHIDGNVSIGHRRLAIIDLKTGMQPMSNEDESIWITYNGELYNYQKLRETLISKGHKFSTSSDTEVIIHAYEEWGKRSVEYFRGMFAFAILDSKKREIFLARDHIGIKPLVYYKNDEYFAFSSELNAFHLLPRFDSSINIESLDQYLHLLYIPPPLSVYKYAFKLLPAQRMVVGYDGEIKTIESYWDLQFIPDNSKSEDDWLDELQHVLKDSIKKHLVSDVPVGAFLSGGIDSTLIVKYMTEQQGVNTPKTFSIGFNEMEYSEIPYSDHASNVYNTDHFKEIVTYDSIEILSSLMRHYGEPFGDDSCIPTFYLSRLASDQVTVVLSGDGADELFCGYIGYERWMKLTRGEFTGNYKRLPLWKKVAYPIAHHLYSSRYPEKYFRRYKKSVEMWIQHVQTLDKNSRLKLWKSDFHPSINGIPAIFEQLSECTEGMSSVKMAQYLDFKTAFPAALLQKVDIASMMNSLEVRTPFADKDVAEFACRIPDKINLKNNRENVLTGKYLLKQLLKNDFSDEFIYRRKMGFTPPILKWFSINGKKRNEIEDYILHNNSHIKEYFNIDSVKQLFIQNKLKPLWLLLVLGVWFDNNSIKNQ